LLNYQRENRQKDHDVAMIAILTIWLRIDETNRNSTMIFTAGCTNVEVIRGVYRVPLNGGVEYNKWKNVVDTCVYVTLTICFLCGYVSLCGWGMAVGIYTRSLSHDYYPYPLDRQLHTFCRMHRRTSLIRCLRNYLTRPTRVK
jgi:hypothetical protein